jgi:alpha-1,3-rhamnosyl/mannosyltransferase
MACGVPTLTARVGATEEIAGDSALLVDPLDTSSIATGLEMLLERPDARAHFSELGRQRVQAYTWDAAAGQMLGLFEH